MNTDFSRRLTQLRKERKLSQKQAAQALGVSQPLLSHYEKGIRESGLDFVVRAAEYYEVSCDYLLGHSATRYSEPPQDDRQPGRISPARVNAMLLSNSLYILYDTLAKVKNRRLSQNVSNYLMLAVYRVFRTLCLPQPNDNELFSIQKNHFSGYSAAWMEKLCADIGAAADKSTDEYLPALETLDLSPDRIAEEHPERAASLFNVVQHAEGCLGKVK